MHRSIVRAIAIVLRLSLISALVLAVTLIVPAQRVAAAGAANDHTVLILGPTVTGGASSREAAAAVAIGLSVEVVDNAGWAAKSQLDFSTYRALILGDATCTGLDVASAAIANTAVWGPAVNGRVLIDGTDPVFHETVGGRPDAGNLTRGGVQFVAGEATRTGAYVSLSCYYHGTAEHTPVPLLDAFSIGGFTVRGVGCFNDAHIVATSPALATVTDASLSNWGCSVHEAFDLWPVAQFDVLAIARGIGSTFTASDGTVGTPYILARGASVISDITLAPDVGISPVGTPYFLQATVHEGGVATFGRMVTFTAIDGPNNGMTQTAGPSNASGQVSFDYTSLTEGTDTWIARFVDSAGHTQTSNRVTVDWTKAVESTLHSLALNGGTTAYAEAPDAAKLNITGDWTLETWFKDQNESYDHNFAKLVTKADANQSGEAPYFLAVGHGLLKAGSLHDMLWRSVDYDLIANKVSIGVWHHAAATLQASTRTVSIYLDGKLVLIGTIDALGATNALPLSIGRSGTAGNYFDGKLDDVRIWNVARTAAQIAANFATEFSSAPAGLVANWKFDEATGSTAADSTAAPDDASLNGGAIFSTDVHP